MRRQPPARRTVARTVLIVGEGYAEEYFLRHLCSIYVQRGSGVQVTIKNARGKGALHVVKFAQGQSRNWDYDTSAALLDTDVGWDQNTQKLARKEQIEVFESSPCFESVLLQIHKMPTENRTTAQLKQAFEATFGTVASEPEVFMRHFRGPLIEDARMRLPVLQRLLTLLETGRCAGRQ